LPRGNLHRDFGHDRVAAAAKPVAGEIPENRRGRSGGAVGLKARRKPTGAGDLAAGSYGVASAAVSGADPIEVRPGFAELLARIADNGVRTIIVETANRFARDLMVQEVGYAMLRSLGVTLVAADSPSSFLDDGPTSNLIRQILGAVSEFDKAWLRPSHPNDFNHTFQWLAELTGKAGRVVPSST